MLIVAYHWVGHCCESNKILNIEILSTSLKTTNKWHIIYVWLDLWEIRYWNFDNNNILRFLSESVEVLEQSTTQQKLTLYGLEKYQNYTIQIVASTKIGEGLKSRSIYCRTQEDGKRSFILLVMLSVKALKYYYLLREGFSIKP